MSYDAHSEEVIHDFLVPKEKSIKVEIFYASTHTFDEIRLWLISNSLTTFWLLVFPLKQEKSKV